MFNKIKSKLDFYTTEVIIKSSKALLAKLIGGITLFLVSMFLSQVLGSEGLGIVSFANRFLMILLILSMFGFENVLIKFIAISKGKYDNQGVASALKTSLIFNGLLSIIIASIGALLLPYFLEFWHYNHDMYIPLLIVFVMIVPETLARVFGSALNGYGKIWKSSLVKNQTLGILFVAIGLLIYYSLSIQFTPISVLILYGISRFFVVFVIIIFWKQDYRGKIKGDFNLKPMLKMAKPMLMAKGTGVLASNLDIMMLGILGSFASVGIYSVAAQLALISSMLSQIYNTSISPKLAYFYSKNKTIEIKLMLRQVSSGLALISFTLFLFFLMFGRWLLYFWGQEFQEAYWILIILSIGQFVSLSSGSSGIVLAMCGFEKIVGHIAIFSIALNITLNFVLISSFGALGAALATSMSVILTNVIRVILAKRKTGILTIPHFIKIP